MARPLREICSHTRDIYCRVFENKIVYEIPCFFGQENALGRAIHLEVALNPRPLKYDPALLQQPLTLTAIPSKEGYKTNIKVEEMR